MPTDVEQQLVRFAEALDRQAPAISVEEIVGRGTVVVDVDLLARPSSNQVLLVHSENGDHGASVELAPAVVEPRARRRVALKVALGAAAAAVLVVALAVVVRTNDEPDPADLPPSTVETVPPTTTAAPAEESPFVGVWLSTDTDGSSQTMEIAPAGTDEYEVLYRDDAATGACSGGLATMTGTARLATDTTLVIAQPELTCDDGTTPAIGPPPQAELANSTLYLDTATDELVDSFGVVWRREGANVDSIAPATSDAMWPQTTLDDVRTAQERADAGDPAYTWQLDARLVDDYWTHLVSGGKVELVDRFIREVLGWEAYVFNSMHEGDRNAAGEIDGAADGLLTDQRFLRCMPGRTNPLNSFFTEAPAQIRGCAPTIDDFNYESISLDLAQLDRRGRNGIWVVNRWRPTTLTQADPAVTEAQATEHVEEWLAARVAGQGAEGYVQFNYDVLPDVPLLYATTSGAPYERFEIQRVDGGLWPDGDRITFTVQLFADGDATVVEQSLRWYRSDGLWMDVEDTTENGQPVNLSYTSSDGEVSASAPTTWWTWSGGGATHDLAPGVWFWELYRGDWPDEDRIEFTDPVAYDAWCAEHGGSPLLSGPADAAAIAAALVADSNFETTAPVAARIGGIESLSIDVALAPGGSACGIGMIEVSRWIHTNMWEPGWRIRLYLVDLPEGMSVSTLAITIVAPEKRFDDVIAETAPIIDSIEFHPPRE